MLQEVGFDPSEVRDWIALVITVGASALAFWKFLISPLEGKIKAEAARCEEQMAKETEARKAADAHRDDRGRELRDMMQAAIGRVEMLERKSERSENDRASIHADLTEMITEQKGHFSRLQKAEINYERSMGEMRTAMAQMETRLQEAVRAAIREAARIGSKNGG